MREIKFRAWCVAEKYWDDQILKTRPLDKILQCNTHILVQYTGLNDKNGKEIYDGDFVKAYVHIGDGEWDYRIGKVSYNPIDAQYEVLDEDDIRTNNIGGHLIAGGEEVIGNIYENPELLPN